MIRQAQSYQVQVREAMRGGTGKVRIEHLFNEGTELPAGARMVARLILGPGDSIGYHTHDGEDEIFYIVRGTAVFNDNGVEAILHTGDSAITGNGGGHSVRNDGADELEILAVIIRYGADGKG